VSACLDAALGYARRGLRVLPVDGKVPRTGHGCKDATTDLAGIRGWWATWPDADVAIATGGGLAVVDVDPRGDGSATPPAEWAALVRGGAQLGERNTTCARLAGYLLRQGVDARVAYELLAAWDERRNRPPLGPDEVDRVVASIARREAARLRGAL
jgi:hypothetical protein